MATRQRSIEYHVIVYAPDANGGPSSARFDLTPYVLNLAWQAQQNMPGQAVFTLARGNAALDAVNWMQDHVKVWRDGPTGLKCVFAGKLIKPSWSGTDVLVYAWDYLAFLQRSRTGYMTMYASKLLGSQVVSPEWTAAKTATNSPFAFVNTGTIEDPLGLDGTTPMKTNSEFGVNLFNRLFTFYNVAEMAMANTSNNVVFEITRDVPHTFNFWKNRGSLQTAYAFVYPGNILPSHTYDPALDAYANDLATVVTNSTSGSGSEYDAVSSDVTTTAYRRLQDAVAVQTLMGLSSTATETDQLKQAVQRQLKLRTDFAETAVVVPRQGEYNPFDGHELGDLFTVRIKKAAASQAMVDEAMRLVGISCAWSPVHGEMPQLALRSVTA